MLLKHGAMKSVMVTLVSLIFASAVNGADQKATQVRLDIYSDVACKLSIRGQPAGQVPARKEWHIWVDAGQMELICESERGNRDVQSLTLQPGITRNIRFAPGYIERFSTEGDGFVADSFTGLVWSRKAQVANQREEARRLCESVRFNGKEGRIPGIDELDLLADAPLNISTRCGSAVCRVPALFQIPISKVFAGFTPPEWFDLEKQTFANIPENSRERMGVLCVWRK